MQGDFFRWPVLLAGAALALVSAGGYVINDYFDIEIDRINRPDRPLPAGRLQPWQALVWALVLCAAGTIVALAVNLTCGGIAATVTMLLFVYSAWLKRTVLAGNLAVSIAAASAFIFGGAAAGDMVPALIPGALAFCFHLGREIIKDLEDMQGDRALQARTLPVVAGETAGRWAVTVVFALLMIVTVLPYWFHIYGLYYLYAVVLGVDIILVSLLFLIWQSRNYGKASRILKVDMIVGLVAVCLGKL
jgi:geranylgeranylglycerol-phosphate geranylgeranyltransferase